jgi:ATP-dependent DNA ligase
VSIIYNSGVTLHHYIFAQILTEDVFEEVKGRIMHVKRERGKLNQHALDFFNDAIDAREEGIIIKAVYSKYQVCDP